MVTVATGIPYVGIVEYAYGISDRFSAGAIIGITPKIPGYGVRLRGTIHERGDRFRVYVRAPVLYYPRTKDLGGEPWVLTWPVVSAEWKIESGTRLSVGGGFVAAACVNSLLGLEEEEEETEGGEGFMGGFWNTLHAGVAFPIRPRLMFQGELSAVLSGAKVAGGDWVGGPPVILVLGLSYGL